MKSRSCQRCVIIQGPGGRGYGRCAVACKIADVFICSLLHYTLHNILRRSRSSHQSQYHQVLPLESLPKVDERDKFPPHILTDMKGLEPAASHGIVTRGQAIVA